MKPCELCTSDGGDVLWRGRTCRVVLVDDRDYPGFCRVIAARHVREMTDLFEDDRADLMNAVFATESALRRILAPTKVNLASLGNVTPHVHWHVIPRRDDDRHFPNPIWGSAVREPGPHATPSDLQSRLKEALLAALGPGG